MEQRRSTIGGRFVRAWASDVSLTVFLVLLLIGIFLLYPIADDNPFKTTLMAVVASLTLISGVLSATRSGRAIFVVILFAALSFVLHWMELVSPGLLIDRAALATEFIFQLVLGAIVLRQVYRPGPITRRRIEGSIVVYILIGLAWGTAYQFAASFYPGALMLASGSAATKRDCIYFSFVTLTTVGFGDIIPVLPVVRSLAMLEALAGQLYPAILIGILIARHSSSYKM